jgi:hypothetical protein
MMKIYCHWLKEKRLAHSWYVASQICIAVINVCYFYVYR